MTALAKVGETMANNPEYTAGIIMAPNTGPFGNEYTLEGMRQSQAEIKALLDDSGLKGRYIEFDVVFNPDTIPKQCKRPGRHMGWLLVSDKMAGSKLRALATKSDLWIRQTVCNVPFSHHKDYVNPLGVGRGLIDPRKDFSQSQRRKQWISGWRVAKHIFDALLSGMQLQEGSVASINVLYPYDSSIVEQALRSSSSVPYQMVCQVVWADLDSDLHLTDHNTKITKWLKASNRRIMKNLLMEKLFFLDGWARPEAGSLDTPRPSYQESNFKIICPAASGHLPLRKEWIDMMQAKYESANMTTELEELMKNHNDTHNPSGKPHESASNKRSASSAGLPSASGDRGIELQHEDGAAENVDELTKSDGPLAMLECFGQKLYFTKSGHMWVWGQKDDVLPVGLAVVLIFGSFHLGDDVVKQKQEAAKKKGKIWDWNMTTDDHRGVFVTKKLADDREFPSDTIHTLKEFLAHLAAASVVDPHVECHEVSTTYQKDPNNEVTGVTSTVKKSQACCFKVCARPANCEPEYDNLGSTLLLGAGCDDWDMTTGQHSKGLLCIADRLSYEEGPELTGIAPLKPGICLMKSILVKKDTLRQLA